MRKRTITTTFLIQLVAVGAAGADCTNCVGDYAGIRTETDFSGGDTHSHDFGAKCDAVNLAGHVGEVYITIRALADLAGTDRYVTANFVSGLSSTAITSGNGFIGAPSDGKFFKTDGVTECPGAKQQATVQMDYDDFNALLAAGDDTVTIEVTASNAVEDLCDLCCESGHAWTPDACCSLLVPCACPPDVETLSEVILVYLDCDVIGEPNECVNAGDCNATFCTGTAQCIDGACVFVGNPCLASDKICDDVYDECDDCTSDQECQDEDGLFCNGQETCVSGTCTDQADPCDPNDEECDEDHDVCRPANCHQ